MCCYLGELESGDREERLRLVGELVIENEVVRGRGRGGDRLARAAKAGRTLYLKDLGQHGFRLILDFFRFYIIIVFLFAFALETTIFNSQSMRVSERAREGGIEVTECK